MSKQDLKLLIDLLPDSDMGTIYEVLIRFIPEDIPLPDEIKAIERGKREIASGECKELDKIEW